jgi:hypothetical protein
MLYKILFINLSFFILSNAQIPPACSNAIGFGCVNIRAPDDCSGNPNQYPCPAGYFCCMYNGACESRCQSIINPIDVIRRS